MSNEEVIINAQNALLDSASKPKSLFGVRHVQVILLFLVTMFAYALRVNMSVAIVAMVDKNSTNPDFEEFEWDEGTRSLILSSFFWGNTIMQMPAAHLGTKYGVKHFLLIAMGLCGFLNIMTPFASFYGGWRLVCLIRVVQGLCQGFVFPSCHILLAKWAPPSERGRLATFAYAGSQLGTVIMLATSGHLAASGLGWPSIFYFSGSAAIIWSVLWFFFGSNSPAESKIISEHERNYIHQSFGSSRTNQKLETPWKSICTSAPFVSLLVVHCSQSWGFWTLLTQMPTYLKNVLGMDIKSNALLSSLPYLMMWLFSFVFSSLSDFVINKKFVTRTASRKIFNTIGSWGPTAALITMAVVGKPSLEFAIVLLTISGGLNAGTYVGYLINHIDLSPNFAGTLMGITNFMSNIMSVFAPLLVGVVEDSSQWQIVFFIASAIYLVGNAVFIIFGNAEVQSWNNPETTTPENYNEMSPMCKAKN